MPKSIGEDPARAFLEAASALLMEEGYRNVSIRKVAARVGCSPGSVYSYFDSKDAIFYALVDQGAEMLCAAYEQVRREATGVEEELEGMGRAYARFGLEHTEYYEVIFVTRPNLEARFPAENYRRSQRPFRMTVETLSRGRQQGVFTFHHSADMAAALMWSLMHGAVSLLTRRRLDTGFDTDLLVENAIQSVLHAVHARHDAS